MCNAYYSKYGEQYQPDFKGHWQTFKNSGKQTSSKAASGGNCAGEHLPERVKCEGNGIFRLFKQAFRPVFFTLCQHFHINKGVSLHRIFFALVFIFHADGRELFHQGVIDFTGIGKKTVRVAFAVAVALGIPEMDYPVVTCLFCGRKGI